MNNTTKTEASVERTHDSRTRRHRLGRKGRARDPRTRRRRIVLASLAVVFILAGGAYAGYWATVLRYQQSTDDAYVDGNRVAVMAQESGTVVAVLANNTVPVKRGQTLVRLDDSDARVALQQAKARLASEVRQVTALQATGKQLQANVGKQLATLKLARRDYARDKRLHASGSISTKALEHDATLVNVDKRSLTAARQAVQSIRAKLGQTGIADNPAVRLAAAQVRAAWLALKRTRIVAPVSGYVAERSVQVGENIKPGTALMAIVPLHQVWIQANFKEAALGSINVGQPVLMHADMYGDSVTFHGRVLGIGAGSGSAFALLPPQNATGNWIKVVQRVPVRIGIARADLAKHPLRVGLSMDVTIETGDHHRRHTLARTIVDPHAYKTAVYDQQAKGSDWLITKIIHANVPGAPARGIAAIDPGSNTEVSRGH